MKTPFKWRYFIVQFGLVAIMLVLGYRLLNQNLPYTILVGIVTTILSTAITNGISKITDIDPMPKIKTYSDRDKSEQEIDRFLSWLVKKKVCNVATLYVRDEMDPNEFNLISNPGTRDSSPMYGPLVFDDFRKKISKANLEEFVASINSTQSENPKGFRARELILSRVSFKLNNEHEDAIAVLYLNWREEQEFSDKQKETLRGYKKQVFSAVQKIEGISKKRQLFYNAELRTRRWTDHHITQAKYKSLDELILDSISQFFTDINYSKLIIEIWRSGGGELLLSKKKDSMWPSDLDDKDNQACVQWVYETTRPKFILNSVDHKIAVPIRKLSNLAQCSGVILIECTYKPLMPEMVKPLCYLADHFSRIEATRENRQKQ